VRLEISFHYGLQAGRNGKVSGCASNLKQLNKLATCCYIKEVDIILKVG